MIRRLFSRRPMSYTARATRDRWAVVFAAEDLLRAADTGRVPSSLADKMAAIRRETGR